jgi:hypothetical protein
MAETSEREPSGGCVMPISHRIVPCLWFDNQAEEAAKFYVSVFNELERAVTSGKVS